MNITFFNFKGGVGKTSLAAAYALSRKSGFVTNDLSRLDHIGFEYFTQLDANRKRIPAELLHEENTVYDMGAMSGAIDPKVIDALKHSEVVVIPTLTDMNSIRATIESIQEAKQYVDVVIVVINRVRKRDRKYDTAMEQLQAVLPASHILMMKETTLFYRLAADGATLFENVGHEKGLGQLIRTYREMMGLFDTVEALAIKGTRIYG